jgi:hypothetical protein
MAGSIFFANNTWSSKSSATFYVFDFLIDRLPESGTKSQLQEYVENNIAMLNLRNPDQAELVDLIADDLPQHLEATEDPSRRENLHRLLDDLILFAKEQQAYNAQAQREQ